MDKVLKQINFENERVSCIKFIRENYLVAAHNQTLTVMNIRDNFTSKLQFNPKSNL